MLAALVILSLHTGTKSLIPNAGKGKKGGPFMLDEICPKIKGGTLSFFEYFLSFSISEIFANS